MKKRAQERIPEPSLWGCYLSENMFKTGKTRTGTVARHDNLKDARNRMGMSQEVVAEQLEAVFISV